MTGPKAGGSEATVPKATVPKVTGSEPGRAERKELLQGRTPDSALDPVAGPIEVAEEASLRPRSLSEFVGQARLKEHLGIVLEAARRRGQAADHFLFCGPPGLGKPVAADSVVLMADGARKRIADVVVGDRVITHRGVAAPVSAVWDQGELACVRLRTEHGRSVVAATDHPFLTPGAWVKAADLVLGSALTNVAAPSIEATAERSGEECRLLGYLVGAGALNDRGDVTVSDPTVLADVRRCAQLLGLAVAEKADGGGAMGGGTTVALPTGLRERLSWPSPSEEGLEGVERLGGVEGLGCVEGSGPLQVLGGVGGLGRVGGLGGVDGQAAPHGLPAWLFSCPTSAIGEFVVGFSAMGGRASAAVLDDVQHLLLRSGAQSAPTDDGRLAITGRSSGGLVPDVVTSIDNAGLVACRCITVDGEHTYTVNDLVCHNTSLAGIVATEMGAGMKITSGPALVRAGDLASILTDLAEGDVLFIDEIHRLGRAVEEILYPAIEDFQLDVVLGKGPAARSLRLDLPRFTLVGATTRTGLITGPLRDRFGMVERLDFYEDGDLEAIIVRAAGILRAPLDRDGAVEIARRARGTPRIANRLLKRVRDFAEVRADGKITLGVARDGLALFGVDALGLDKVDRAILSIICERFGGGPVGLSTLAVSVGEETETVEDVYEPFLLQRGLLKRTPRGRVATAAAWAHLGIEPPDQGPGGSPALW